MMTGFPGDPVYPAEHRGCAYQTANCQRRDCKPAELCPAGHQVYRNWTGGGHHHEEDGDE